MNCYEQFHDGFFEGIWIPERGTVHVHLATADRQRSTAVLVGVVMVRVSGFREGNIIFDVGTHEGNEPTLNDIALLYDLKPNHHPEEWELQLLQKIRGGSLLLFEITASYGGECLILAESVELLGHVQWLQRYGNRLESGT